jgi:FkbM family methyltransferase
MVRTALGCWLGKFTKTSQISWESLEIFKLSLLVAIECGKRVEAIPTELRAELRNFTNRTSQSLPETYHGIDQFDPEVFLFQHGLKHLPPPVLETIKTRDILDIGASIGDSALVLSEYGRMVYSIELALSNVERMRQVLAMNRRQALSIRVFHRGVSDHVGIGYALETVQGFRLSSRGAEVDLTTIDSFVDQRALSVGFIKVDVGGHGFEVAKGGITTILKNRPVISFAVYSSFKEMYNLSNLLLESLPDYVFEWQMLRQADWAFNKIVLIGYPYESLESPVANAE